MACRARLGSLSLFFFPYHPPTNYREPPTNIFRDSAGEGVGKGRQNPAEDLSLGTDSSLDSGLGFLGLSCITLGAVCLTTSSFCFLSCKIGIIGHNAGRKLLRSL